MAGATSWEDVPHEQRLAQHERRTISTNGDRGPSLSA
jgi:hypothetical protein